MLGRSAAAAAGETAVSPPSVMTKADSTPGSEELTERGGNSLATLRASQAMWCSDSSFTQVPDTSFSLRALNTSSSRIDPVPQ